MHGNPVFRRFTTVSQGVWCLRIAEGRDPGGNMGGRGTGLWELSPKQERNRRRS